MDLSRADETDLLVPLHAGVHETPRWATFLRRIKQRTRADHAALLFAAGDAPTTLASYADQPSHGASAERVAAIGIDDTRRIAWEALRPGRVYAARDLAGDDHYRGTLRPPGAAKRTRTDERVVRIAAVGFNAWMMLARGGEFTAADGALLSALVPHLATAMETLAAIDRLRRDLAASEEAAARDRLGWIALDRDARILSLNDAARGLLRGAGVAAAPGERVTAIAGDLAAAALPTPVTLAHDLDAMIVPASSLPVAGAAAPAALALLRGPAASLPPRSDAIARLLGLTPSEARLAAVLAEGGGVAEAAARTGLSLETARNYSKRVYAKTGARGQADLARRLALSVATLA